MEKSSVSIIIPSHNYARFLPDAVASAFRQNYKPLEIIIVNDGSTDNTDEVAKSYLSDSRVKYIALEEKMGLPVARNEAIKISSGEYLNFLDADDILEDGAIEAMAGVMDNHPDSSMVVGRRIDFDDTGKFFILDSYFPEEMEKETFKKLVYRDFVCVSGCLVRKKCLEKTGKFNPQMRIYEDYDLWLRLALYFPFSPLNRLVTRKRFHSSNMSHPRHILDILAYEIKALENVLEIAGREKNENNVKLLQRAIFLRKKWLGKEACLHGEFGISGSCLQEYLRNNGGGNLKLRLIARFPGLACCMMKFIKSYRGFVKSLLNPDRIYNSIPETIPRLG